MTSPRTPGTVRVTVVSGPTAVGKGTVVAALRARHPEVWLSTSATTRAPRPREVEGVHYHFVSGEEFDELLASDGLLEWALVHGTDRYGTPRAPVDAALAEGLDVVLEIELQGARQVRESLPGARFVFIAPPSWDELVRRLEHRGTETLEQRERRLKTAEAELASQSEFDHVVVNDRVDRAVEELVGLMGLRPPNTQEGLH
ncbi:guanylate kinase [Ammonicoccus fulvus]|uniref:Guanylate kinase n=1 Tax=Ammonicoccus fulvus TaxID=3138240 RepID=A0ABZ3FNC5_9ACTN